MPLSGDRRLCQSKSERIITIPASRKRGCLPSHVTIREVLKGINFDDVLTAFNEWAKQYVTVKEKEWMAIDGKAPASTVTDYSSSYQNFVSLVSVFSHKRGQVLRVSRLENNKCSEIPTVQELIEALDLTGVVLSLDSLHCQKNCRSRHRQRQ